MSASSTLFVSQSLSLCSFCRVYLWFSLCLCLSVSVVWPLPLACLFLCSLFPLVPDFHHFDHFSVILGSPCPTGVPTHPAPRCFRCCFSGLISPHHFCSVQLFVSAPPELPPVCSPLCSVPSPLSPVFALFFILIFFILSVSASALCP